MDPVPFKRAATLALLLTSACAEIQYSITDTHDEVVATTTKRVPTSHDAAVELDGTILRVRTRRLCSIVEDNEIERQTVREPDEEVFLEVGLMVASLAPLAGGTALVVDSRHVYQDDPNQRLYNKAGPDAPLALGIVSLIGGAAMLLPATVQLIRKTAPDYDEETIHQPGAVLRTAVPCRDQAESGGVPVVGQFDNGGSMPLGHTNPSGSIDLDLATALPPTYFGGANEPTSMTININGQSYGTVSLEPVVTLQERRRERAWQGAHPERCARERTERACAGVRLFVQSHPGSYLGQEGQALLANIGSQSIAADPRRAGCERACMTRCESNQSCATRCIEDVCP